MNTTLEALSAANETTLQLVTTLHERVLAAYRELAAQSTPVELPAGLAQFFPQPDPALVRGFVEETSSFAAKLVEANKSFALGLLGTTQSAFAGR